MYVLVKRPRAGCCGTWADRIPVRLVVSPARLTWGGNLRNVRTYELVSAACRLSDVAQPFSSRLPDPGFLPCTTGSSKLRWLARSHGPTKSAKRLQAPASALAWRAGVAMPSVRELARAISLSPLPPAPVSTSGLGSKSLDIKLFFIE